MCPGHNGLLGQNLEGWGTTRFLQGLDLEEKRIAATFPLQGNFTNVLRSIGCALVLVGYDECIALLKAYV